MCEPASNVLRTASYLGLFLSIGGCAARPSPGAHPLPASLSVPDASSSVAKAGVLVMAHGGSAEWNASVEAAVAPLREEIPTAIAFGMADPVTLQQAVDELESAGVVRIAVVRLFISGDSFLHRTQYLLNKRADPPPRGPMTHGSAEALYPIHTSGRIEIDPQGLVDGFETGFILRDRTLSLSREPSSEVVLVLGHGNGDENVNRVLLENMEARADAIRAEGFREVRVETLREDWAAARELAESRIHAWVANSVASGMTVLVVPMRLSGFGPFRRVLEGLDYEADGLGLLPNEAITEWLRRRTQALFCAHGWQRLNAAGESQCDPR